MCSWSWSCMQYAGGFGPGISSGLPLTCCSEQATFLFPGPGSGSSVSSIFPFCKTQISVHHSLALLFYKTDLKYLLGLEDLLSFPYTLHPPFNT